jgi:hypothetical protein
MLVGVVVYVMVLEVLVVEGPLVMVEMVHLRVVVE